MSGCDNINGKIVREDANRLDAMVEDFLERPYWIIDILPQQVPADAGGQYYAVERYFLQPERIRSLRRRYAQILLKLNCYYDMLVSYDFGENWEKNPDPEIFAENAENIPENAFLRALFQDDHAMMDLEGSDTYMTIYDPDNNIIDRVKKLAEAEGLFLWQPPFADGKILQEADTEMMNEKCKETGEQKVRISYYEKLLSEAEDLLKKDDLPAEQKEELQAKVKELEEYYTSPAWKRDFEDDSAGRLPEDLKRGVLSEDGIYNVLEEYKEKTGE